MDFPKRGARQTSSRIQVEGVGELLKIPYVLEPWAEMET